MVQRFLVPIRGMLRGLVAEWAAANPELAGPDPAAYACERCLLMGLAPGFMVQRAVLADFDEDAYLATVRTLLRAERQRHECATRPPKGQMRCQPGLFAQACR